jgi:hypothetical protein
MVVGNTMKLERTKQRIEASDANLTGASITDSQTEGMTINGISLADLMAAYRAACGSKPIIDSGVKSGKSVRKHFDSRERRG